jgi:hypothetical protein
MNDRLTPTDIEGLTLLGHRVVDGQPLCGDCGRPLRRLRVSTWNDLGDAFGCICGYVLVIDKSPGWTSTA